MSGFCDCVDCSPPGSSVHGIPRQEYLSGWPFPSPGHLPDPGVKPASPELAGGFSTTELPGKPSLVIRLILYLLHILYIYIHTYIYFSDSFPLYVITEY